ncbi:hypothetical protein SCHPADRAFT_174731 [Schizopora paradoxa]|uniref:Uncharacterized protein n=1 Tax=Schizopora paradoxa TaxID=27342 RepID=A0A0H2RZ05_9AGAM|nr:hypothetical protein SCHPADRAFT_174731 [Schizopora paradoxa]
MLELPPPPSLQTFSIRHSASAYGMNPTSSSSSSKTSSPSRSGSGRNNVNKNGSSNISNSNAQKHKSEISPPSTCPDTAEGTLVSPPQPPRGRTTLRRPLMRNTSTTASITRQHLEDRDVPRNRRIVSSPFALPLTTTIPPASSLPLAFVHPQAMHHVARKDSSKSASTPPSAAMGALVDDELLFQMSPVVSPKHSAFFDVLDQRAESNAREDPPAQKTLKERWDVQADFMLGSKELSYSQHYQQQIQIQKPASSASSKSKASSSNRNRTGTLTLSPPTHHRVRSALVVGAHSDVARCSTQDGRTRFDCAECCGSPTSTSASGFASVSATSPPKRGMGGGRGGRKPFWYTFPTFKKDNDASSLNTGSVPSLPMPIRREGLDPRSVFGSSPELGGSAGERGARSEATIGPIRARNMKLGMQSRSSLGSSAIAEDELASVRGEGASEGLSSDEEDYEDEGDDEDEDDGNVGEGFIPGAFDSEAFDGVEEQEQSRYAFAIASPLSSSRSSSMSSSSAFSSTEYDEESEGEDVLPKSLLASFPPVRREVSEPASLVRDEEGPDVSALPRTRSARFYLGAHPPSTPRRAGSSSGSISHSYSARKME